MQRRYSGAMLVRVALTVVTASSLIQFAIAATGQNPGTSLASPGYGSGGGAVYMSTDGGGTWQVMNTGLSSQSVTALAIDPVTPSTIYMSAGTSEINARGGVFKSADGGSSWRAASTGLDPDVTVGALVIDPQAPTTLYVGSDRGVFKSTDAGGDWHALNTRLSHPNVVSALVINPRAPTVLYAATMSGVFKSTDGGTSWRALDPVDPRLAARNVSRMAIDPQTPTILYATAHRGVGSVGGLFKSTDGGMSWRPINARLADVNVLTIDPRTPTTLYAADLRGGVFKSTDGGGSWQAINAGLTNPKINALTIDPQTSTTLYVGTLGSGVFKSINGGASWQAINAGLADFNVWAMAIDPRTPTTLYAGTYSLAKYTISLDTLGVAFELPKGFGVVQREFGEPYYAAIITFGREIRPGQLKYAGVQLVFWPTAYDGSRSIPEYRPSQYVDVEYERVREAYRGHSPGFGWDPEYIQLFGNKAVRYTVAGLGGTTVVVGYFRADQAPKGTAIQVPEYLVRITTDAFDEKSTVLFNTVVDSLRTIR